MDAAGSGSWRWTPWRLGGVVVATAVMTVGALSVSGRLLDLLTLLFVCVVLAWCLEPAVNWLARRRVPRHAASVLVLTASAGSLVALVTATGAAVSGQLQALQDTVPGALDSVVGLAAAVGWQLDGAALADYVTSWLRAVADGAPRHAGAAASTIGQVAFNLAVGVFVVHYLLADAPKLRRAVCSLLPPARQSSVLHGWEIAIDQAGRYFLSRLVMAGLCAVATWVTLRALGVPHAEALALWMGAVSQVVPVVGTYIGGALPVLVALTVSPSTALWTLVALVVYQQVENFLLMPWVTARTLSLHPAVALVVVIAGGAVLGVAGVVIALPVLATTQAIVSTYLRRHELVESYLFSGGRRPQGGRSGAGAPSGRPVPPPTAAPLT